MAGKFVLKSFADINLNDVFFDSLKSDYPEFEDWYNRKIHEGRRALVFEDELGVAAFAAMKSENEAIITECGVIPKEERLKVSTLKISERYRGERYGEGAIGLLLWKWQDSGYNEIYVTAFDKHRALISQLERFGFNKRAYNPRGEGIYFKDRRSLDFSDPYRAFPFIKSDFDYGGYLIIDDNYHDTMFAYSELKNNRIDLQNKVGNSVINGLSKIYVGRSPIQNHRIGEPVFIYRKDTKNRPGKRYRSCITSFAIVTDIVQAKVRGTYQISFENLKKRIGNKSVFDEKELLRQYREYDSVLVMELLYYGYFGAGNNVTMDWLDRNDCWKTAGMYPTEIHLSVEQFKKVLKEGKVNVPNVVVD